jgi:hypothetical protein
MRVVVAIAVLVVVTAAAFALGRATASSGDNGDAASAEDDITVEIGDQLEVPALALFCSSDVELRSKRLLCNRTGETPRWQVIFERERTQIVRIGDPGDVRSFPERR